MKHMANNTNLRSTPKDFFLHLLNIIIFYVAVVNFITLFIQYINVLYPDPLTFYYNSISDSIRVTVSILLIAVPVYILTSWMLGKDLKQNPAKRELKLRKWLVYFTLFVAALTIIIDLIILVNNFLSGELTAQFFLKILLVLIVAGSIFAYYIWDLKRTDKEKSKLPKLLAWVISIVVLVSIILGFFIIGTPGLQRDRRFDNQRINNLQTIQYQIVNYWDQKGTLPNDLNQLKDSISGYTAPIDPETGESYKYNVLGELTFELCANFKTDSNDFGLATLPPDPYFFKGISSDETWAHGKGMVCFERTIDPELYNSNISKIIY